MKALSTLLLTIAFGLGGSTIASAGTISHSGTTIGPRGGVTTANSSTTCTPGSSCQHQRVTTAPNGAQATVNSSTTCANGTCTRNAARTGLRGQQYSHTGTTTHP